jgi:hypothetical protein
MSTQIVSFRARLIDRLVEEIGGRSPFRNPQRELEAVRIASFRSANYTMTEEALRAVIYDHLFPVPRSV